MPVAGGTAAGLELVLADGGRVPVVDEVTIGRAPGSTLLLDDPSVSRVHARVVAGNGESAFFLEDAGSSHGTFLDGERVTEPRALRDGARIQLGNVVVVVERQRSGGEAGRTIVVRPGASLVMPAAGAAGEDDAATHFGPRPRLRSGYALKRLEEEEGARRWVLRDLRGGTFLRLGERDADLLELLDGRTSLAELVAEADRRFGATGPPRLARLLAELGERGLLAGVAGADAGPAPVGRLRRLFTPREKVIPGLGRVFEAAYRRGGWVLFTRPGLWALGVLAVAGIGVFGYLLGGRYGTPFVVAEKIGIGGLVFLGGRFAVVAVHELAHGLAMASLGRRVERAGFKVLVVLPFAFVDTSEAWFEPRRRRIGVSAAGPVSDLALGAIFSICSLAFSGTVREVFFQLAFAAYVGAFFNLNPFLDRDGYHMLVDWLREPGLRRRARDQLDRRLSGRGAGTDSPVLRRYALAGLAWSVAAAVFAIFLSLRYEKVAVELAPAWVVWVVLVTLWVALFVPVVWVIGRPLVRRVRGD